MAVQKPLRAIYQSRNFATGLTDVKASVFYNGAAKAVGAGRLTLTELDSTNAPGIYELLIPAATLTTYGVVAGSYNGLECYIDSASRPLAAPFKAELTVANLDDIDAKLGTPSSASVSADIAALAASLALQGTAINNLMNAANIGGAAIPSLAYFIPVSGSNSYLVPITITNSDGVPVVPTSISVGMLNAAGQDRGSYITGSSGSPATLTPTAISAGLYKIPVVIPANAVEEQELMQLQYVYQGVTYNKFISITLQTDISGAGYASQTSVNTANTNINSILSTVNSTTYGNAALQVQAAGIGTNVATGLGILQNGTYGNAALQAQIAAAQGAGFVTATDSLHQISLQLQAGLYTGGRAV